MFVTSSDTTHNPGVFQSFAAVVNNAGIFYQLNQGNGKPSDVVIADNAGNLVETTGGTNTVDGVKRMITITYDGSNVNVYLNGSGSADITSAYSSGAAYQATNYVRIGCLNMVGVDSNFGDKVLSKLGFWSRVLTSGEITTLYNAGAGLLYSQFPSGGATAHDFTLLGVGT